MVKALVKDISANKQAAMIATWEFSSKTEVGDEIDLQPYTASLSVQVSGILDVGASVIFEGTIDNVEWVKIEPVRGSDDARVGNIVVLPTHAKKIRPVLLTSDQDTMTKITVTMFGRGI